MKGVKDMDMKKTVIYALVIVCVVGLTALIAIGQDDQSDPQMHPMGMDKMMMKSQQTPDTSKAARDSLKKATDLGIGPVKHVELDSTIDEKLAQQGKADFNEYCSQCHAMKERKAGPPLGTVTDTRTPEFIMNMVLNPEGMEHHDPGARKLLEQYNIPMPELNVPREKARAILEYLRMAAAEQKKG
jgi:cytochrome c